MVLTGVMGMTSAPLSVDGVANIAFWRQPTVLVMGTSQRGSQALEKITLGVIFAGYIADYERKQRPWMTFSEGKIHILKFAPMNC